MSIDSIVTTWLGDQRAGVGVLVIRNGKTLHKRGRGLANVEREIAVDSRTMFELASLSKQFTATAIMMLVERGKLAYDDPLTKFFPFPSYARTITVRHLLHHTAGLKDYFALYDTDADDDPRWGDRERPSSADIVAALAQEPHPAFAAGERFDYSNSGYVVLGQIATKAADMALPDFMAEAVWKPLGMSRTRIFDGTPIHDANQARGYEEDEPFEITPLDDAYGDGGVRTTLDDLELWNGALDANKVVSKETQELAWTSGTTNDGEETGYGFGWFIAEDDDGNEWVNHEGEYGGFKSYCSKQRAEDGLSVFVVSNFAEAAPDKLGDSITASLR